MTYPARFTFDELLDEPGTRRLRLVVVLLCAVVTTLDGFDLQAIALAAPAIAEGWGVGPSAFGAVFGVGLFGSLVGALLLGRLGDRFGRRRVLLISVAVFTGCSLATALVGSVAGLVVVRFLTGIGLGGALPSAIALTSEYTPRRSRGTVVGLMFCGYPFGGVLAGLLSAPLIPAFGWASVFVVGGVLPLVLLPVLWTSLPESAQFLNVTGDRVGLGAVLRRMGSRVDAASVEPERAPDRSPVVRLFTEGRAAGTLLIWATMFMALLLAYLLTSWVPLVTRAAGAGAGGAALAVAALNVGAIAGCLVFGRLADRLRPTVVIGVAFCLGASAIAALGHVGPEVGALLVVTFAAGFGGIGGQMCMVAVTANFYETSLRATGIGASMGVGRIGGILGPVLGGLLVGAGAGAPAVFGVAAGAALCAAVAIVAMGIVTRERRRQPVSRSSGVRPPTAGAPAVGRGSASRRNGI
ncbi:MAG: transporter, family, 4-hydroxybenzoate transporter [Pseudonocardiales bacterium]|nr:transporter, family, 4-hydroxybenzoate transporter [Pseudonocardiales bacterium]